ncbi:MAG TPA: protein kinase [Bryobacteraceae bacterium]|nr:protein kinase [Bryobacteraceae bacterium]
MTAERWPVVRELFEKCVECPPEHRKALLGSAEGEPGVIQEVLTLLRCHDEMGQDFLRAAHGGAGHATAVLATGELIAGRFETRRLIGQGGMGEVYEAYDRQLDELVALKVLQPSLQHDSAATARLVRELQLARRISHVNVCRVFDLLHHQSRSGELLVLTMELIEGETLDQKIAREGPFAMAEAADVARQILMGLSAAHKAGVIHRDLKPSNIMLTQERVVITDFGVARRATTLGSAVQTCTESRFLIGTLDYMAPEQIRGDPVTPQTDIYSAGLIFFELSTGRKPFSDSDPLRRALKRSTGSTCEVPQGHPNWRTLIHSCLKLRPEDRPRSAAEAMGLLERAPTRFRTRAVAVICAIALLVLTAIAAVLGRRPAPARPVEFSHIGPLTALLGPTAYPALSPDGSKVAYCWGSDGISVGNLYVVDTDGTHRKRLSFDPRGETHPVWSPDGKWIAFLRNLSPSADLVIIPSSGGPERRLMFLPFSAGHLTWSHDGAFIGYTHTTFEQSPGQIHLLSVKTGEDFAVTSPTTGYGDVGAAFSPDDRWLALIRFHSTDPKDMDVYIVELDARHLPQKPPVQITFDHAPVEGLAWTGDGRNLVLTSKRHSSSFGLWLVRNVTSAGPEHVIEPLVVGGGEATSPSASATSLVYQLDRSLGSHIQLVQLRGSHTLSAAACASSTRDIAPQLSPDGKMLYFTSTRSGSREIWSCDLATGNAEPLTALGVSAGSPSVSPNGRELVFDGASHGHWAIYRIALGSRPSVVVDGPGNAVRPSWSNDAKWIYFSSDRNGDWQVWKMSAAGGAAIQVTREGGFESFESPDGAHLFFTKRNQPGLWMMPLSGDGGAIRRVVLFGDNGRWARASDGIYLLREREDRPGTLQLSRVGFADHNLKIVTEFAGNLEYVGEPSVAVLPAHDLIAYSRPGTRQSDIMMLSGLR